MTRRQENTLENFRGQIMRIDFTPSYKSLRLIKEFMRLREVEKLSTYDAAIKLNKNRTYLMALCKWYRDHSEGGEK